MTELHRDLGAAVGMHEVHDALPRHNVLGSIHARTAGRDPSLPRHIRHFAEHEAGPADRAAAEMYEMPVIGHPVLRDVLAHRRDNDATGQPEIAEPKWREHRGRRGTGDWGMALPSRLFSVPLIDRLDKLRVAHLQIVVRNAQTARQQIEGKLERLEVHVPLGILEPLETHLCRALEALDSGSTLGFIGSECRRHVALATQRYGKGNRVFDRELRSRAHGEVRGVRSVAQQHHVAIRPGSVLYRDEVAPERAVLEQSMTFELFLK